ncbi:unnamed protein product, partial [Symbiodinium sp. CCMP2456]
MMLNSAQLRIYRLVFGVKRGQQENWVDYNKRSLRTIRAWMSANGVERWSTRVTKFQYSLLGHWCRRREGDEECMTALMLGWRNLKWWRAEQKNVANGKRHPRRFHATNTERDIAEALGVDWMCHGLDPDKVVWKMLEGWTVFFVSASEVALHNKLANIVYIGMTSGMMHRLATVKSGEAWNHTLNPLLVGRTVGKPPMATLGLVNGENSGHPTHGLPPMTWDLDNGVNNGLRTLGLHGPRRRHGLLGAHRLPGLLPLPGNNATMFKNEGGGKVVYPNMDMVRKLAGMPGTGRRLPHTLCEDASVTGLRLPPPRGTKMLVPTMGGGKDVIRNLVNNVNKIAGTIGMDLLPLHTRHHELPQGGVSRTMTAMTRRSLRMGRAFCMCRDGVVALLYIHKNFGPRVSTDTANGWTAKETTGRRGSTAVEVVTLVLNDVRVVNVIGMMGRSDQWLFGGPTTVGRTTRSTTRPEQHYGKFCAPQIPCRDVIMKRGRLALATHPTLGLLKFNTNGAAVGRLAVSHLLGGPCNNGETGVTGTKHRGQWTLHPLMAPTKLGWTGLSLGCPLLMTYYVFGRHWVVVPQVDNDAGDEVMMMQRGAPSSAPNNVADEERDELISVGWTDSMLANLNNMLEFLQDVGDSGGVEHVAWALGMWAYSNILAETTVELVNDVLFRRVQGDAWFTANDIGEPAPRTPAGEMLQFNNTARALSVARQRARAMIQRARAAAATTSGAAPSSGHNASAPGVATSSGSNDPSPGGATTLDAAPLATGAANDEVPPEVASDVDSGVNIPMSEDGENDATTLMQLTPAEEEQLHQLGVDDRVRRQLRDLLRGLCEQEGRGVGAEHRWGVAQVVEAARHAEGVTRVLVEILERRT